MLKTTLVLFLLTSITFIGLVYAQETKFSAAGDWDDNSNTESVIDMISNQNTDTEIQFNTLQCGDLAYSSTQSTIDDWWFDDPQLIWQIRDGLNEEALPTLGNHETDVQDYTDATGITDWTYSVDVDSAKLTYILIDVSQTTVNQALVDKVTQLSQTAVNKGNDLIACFHFPVYTPGGSGIDHPVSEEPDARTFLSPIFDQFGYDMIIQGHNHVYSRTLPVIYDSNDSDKYRIFIDGVDDESKKTMIITAGTGGRSLDTGTINPTNIDATTIQGKFGALVCTATLIKYDCKFIDKNNNQLDNFIINRTPPAPPTLQHNITTVFSNNTNLIPNSIQIEEIDPIIYPKLNNTQITILGLN